jgi:hypothetical protein
MESTLRNEVCREVRKGDGNLLLHDEVEERGKFEIVPQWNKVEESDVMTPREVYDSITKEGYKVNYERIAIVSFKHSQLLPFLIHSPDGRTGTAT